MKSWISQGEQFILLLDANEYTKNGKLVRAIRSDQKLKMKELVRDRAHKDGPDA